MPTALKWYDDTFTEISAQVPISGSSGIAGTAEVLYLINGKDGAGAETARNVRVRALFAAAGEDPVASGHEWADRHYLEVRLESAGWNRTDNATPWLPLGSNAVLFLPELPDDQGVQLSFRLNAPASALAADVEVSLRVEDGTAEATSQGLIEAAGAGVYLPVRDTSENLQLVGADVVENPGGADRDVQVQEAVYLAAGGLYADEQQLLTIPNAAAGLERYDLVSLAADGSGYARAAGSEVTAGTITDSDKPAVPTGDLVVSWVLAGDSTAQPAVQDADIENAWELSLYAFASTGLTATIARGPHAVVDNSLTLNTAPQQASLTASATNHIWLLRSGALAVTTDGSRPSRRVLLLWEADTDGSGVAALRDRRPFTGRREVLRFEWLGEVAVDDYRYLHLHAGREAWILPVAGVVASLGTQVVGSGLSGQTRWDVEVDDGGGWSSIFGRKPEIAFDATDLRTRDSLPIAYRIPAGARVRAKVSEVPAGTITTAPQDAALSLEVLA